MSALETALTTPAVEAPPIAAVETPVATETPAVEAPPANETRRELISRQIKAVPDSAGRLHGDKGRYVSPNGYPLPAAETPAFPVPQRPAMPKSLKKELEAHWNQAHPELASAFVQREADYEKDVAPLRDKAKVADELLNEFRPYQQMLASEGGTPQTAMRQLLQTAALFRTGSPAQKAQAVAQLMQQYSVSQEDLQQVLSGAIPIQQGLDPQQVRQLVEQRFSQFQEQQARVAAESQLEAFGQQPNHKHFQSVRKTMGALMMNEDFQSRLNGKSESDILEAAYQSACWANDEIRSQLMAEQQAASTHNQQAQRVVQQAKQAAVQVHGAPQSAPAPKVDPSNRRELIKNAIRGSR